ncbi:MAG: hypothetical protein AAGA08_01225 [Pseudomonadota bacterium]
MLYAEDSFFTLSLAGRIALASLSLVLSVGCLWIVFYCVEGLGRFVRLLIALAVFYLFIWLSPQVYYLFYLIIIDGLPLQWVIQSPPGLRKILRLMTFTERATLTEHGQGVLWWALAVTALMRRRTRVSE